MAGLQREMIGLGWRDPSFGESLIVEKSGKIKRIPAGEERKPGHGPSHDFVVTTLAADHPIYRGIPETWLHPFEQLTHGQHGPAKNLTVLSYAWSKDTDENEPMDWVIPYGPGPCLHDDARPHLDRAHLFESQSALYWLPDGAGASGRMGGYQAR
ncbi:MAG: hypothetical protein R2724_12860 [Bryobacterales bacterium]